MASPTDLATSTELIPGLSLQNISVNAQNWLMRLNKSLVELDRQVKGKHRLDVSPTIPETPRSAHLQADLARFLKTSRTVIQDGFTAVPSSADGSLSVCIRRLARSASGPGEPCSQLDDLHRCLKSAQDTCQHITDHSEHLLVPHLKSLIGHIQEKLEYVSMVLDVIASDQSRLLRRLSPQISPDERATIAWCLRTDDHEVTLSVGSKTLSAPRSVLNYWSGAFATGDEYAAFDLDEDIVSYDALSEVLNFCYTDELKAGIKEEHDLHKAADYLKIPSLAIQVDASSAKRRVHYTRRVLPGLNRTIDLRTTCRDNGSRLELNIERSEFNSAHVRRDNNAYYLDIASEFPHKSCFFRFGNIVDPDRRSASEALLEDLFLYNIGRLLKLSPHLSQLAISGIPPRHTTVERLAGLFSKQDREQPFTLEFFEPAWDDPVKSRIIFGDKKAVMEMEKKEVDFIRRAARAFFM